MHHIKPSEEKCCFRHHLSGGLLRPLQLKRFLASIVASTLLVTVLVVMRPAENVIIGGYLVISATGANLEPAPKLTHYGSRSASGKVITKAHEVVNEDLTLNGSLYGDMQESRQRRLATVCADWSMHPYGGRSWSYKVDARHRLIYCPIPKAGWSSWKRLLFYINGAINSTDVEIGIAPDTNAGVLDASHMAVSRIQKMPQRRSFLFVFVRNPWARLVSAYINKAVDWNYTRILHTPCQWESMEPYNQPLTFTQFLTCVSKTAENGYYGLDMHWTPMWQLCDFCRLRYDYIGHMETLAEDSRSIIEQNQLNVTFPKVFSSKAYRVDEVMENWYASVPINVIRSLRKLYELDFALHGYSDVPPGWEGRLT